jgi:Icc-related predicted phosphoesterase
MALRVLAVADIHSHRSVLRVIQQEVTRHTPDVTVVAGDLTNYGDAAEVQRVLEAIPGRVLAIPGNLDLRRAFDAGIVKSHAESVVGKQIEIQGVRIAGLFDHLTACEILVVHEPPVGLLDDVGGGRHIGFPEHFKALKRLQPKVLLCGHCHESPGVVTYGGTTVVNCTLGSGGHGALIEVDGDLVAARLL